MADADAIQRVTLTRDQARRLRQSAKDGRLRAIALIRRATTLCTRCKKTEEIAAEKADSVSGAALPVRRTIHARGVEIVEQLKKSLSDLETIRLIPADDPKLRELKEDIRKSIQRAETAAT